MAINNDYRDFYIKYVDHPKYNDNQLLTESKTDMIVNKLEVILTTNKGECIADPNLGADLSYYLWQTNVSAEKIKGIIREQINIYIPELNDTQYTLNVNLIEGELRDIMLVDIIIDDQQIRAVLQ